MSRRTSSSASGAMCSFISLRYANSKGFRRYSPVSERTVALQRSSVHTVYTVRSRSEPTPSPSQTSVDSSPARRSRKGMHRNTLAQSARAKHAFLECFAQWANISYACEMAGVARRNVYDWQERDEDFSRAFKIAESAATERLEREAWRRAVDGSPYKRTSYWHGEPVGTDEKIEYSDQLLQLLLRARRPDVYREKVDVAVSQIVKSLSPVSIQLLCSKVRARDVVGAYVCVQHRRS